MPDMRGLWTHKTGFTLVELMIVVVILAILAMIAMAGYGSASEDAKESALTANLQIMREVLQRYRVEHHGRGPELDENGNTDLANALDRLMSKTQRSGKIDANGPLGPYLRRVPTNPYNERNDIRMDGAAPGANTAGWHYNSSTQRFSADDSAENAEL